VRILSFGELLWDVIRENEYLGGAPLNFSASAQRLGNPTTLLTGVGADARGARAIEQMKLQSLTTRFVFAVPDAPTGTAVVTTDDAGNATYLFARPAAFDRVPLSPELLEAIREMNPDWIYCGTLTQTDPANEALLHRLTEAVPEARRFYDINLREGHWNFALVERLSRCANLIKLNDAEAETLFKLTCASEPFSIEAFCRFWSSTYGPELICVTRGGEGCSIWANGRLSSFAGFPVQVSDTVGAGDAFGAAFLHGYHHRWSIGETARFANALGSIVASRPGATPAWTIEECFERASIAPAEPG
jgi:fructokinase